MILGSFASCGKSNSVPRNTLNVLRVTNTENPLPLSSSITSTVPGQSALGGMIDNYSTQFGTGRLYYGGNIQTWGTLSNTGLELAYRYTKSTANTSVVDQNCTKKWIFFTVCSSSSSSGTSVLSSTVVSRKVLNSTVDITTKINELKGYINNANPLITINVNGTSYMFKTKDGKSYVIDTSYPIQANPIVIMDSTGTEYMFDIRENI